MWIFDFFPSNHLVFQRWLFLVSNWRVMSAGKDNSLTRSIFGWFAFVTGVEWVRIPDSIFCHFDGVWAEMRIAQNFMQDPILFFILICWYDVFVQVNIHFLFQSKFLLCRSVDFVTWKHRKKTPFGIARVWPTRSLELLVCANQCLKRITNVHGKSKHYQYL